MARLIQVIEVDYPRGQGTSESVHRLVTQYYSVDGTLLAERDPCQGEAVDEAIRNQLEKDNKRRAV